MTCSKVKHLADLCRPVVEFLQKNCTPHETVVITDGGFKMTSDVVGMPLDNPYKSDEDTRLQLQKMIDEYFDKELERKRREKGTPFDNMVKRMIERSRV